MLTTEESQKMFFMLKTSSFRKKIKVEHLIENYTILIF